MTVYIEYAFLENFLLDGALLWLSQKACRFPTSWGKVVFAATLGAAFALVYPLLRLPALIKLLLKIAVGLLLPLLATKRIPSAKIGGRYALNATLFLALTFVFGGGLLAFGRNKSLPAFTVVLSFAAMAGVALLLIELLYRRAKVGRLLCPCTLRLGDKRLRATGFIDSGNLAKKDGLPVCFLSPEAFVSLVGDRIVFGDGSCESMRIYTATGSRQVALYRGEIELKMGGLPVKKEVYFARAANRISQEYQLLLPSVLLEGE